MPRSPKAYVYQDDKGDWRYSVRAGNGKGIGHSEEGFSSKAYVRLRLKDEHPTALIVEGRPPTP